MTGVQTCALRSLLRIKAELNEYVADINLAHQSILAGNLDRATEFLAKHHAGGVQRFEWRYLRHAAQGDDHKLLSQEASSALSLSSSPEWLVVGLQDAVRIYDATTGSLVKSLAKSGASVALSTNGLLAAASQSTVRIWRASDWTELYSLPDLSAPVAFSRDGRLLAANSREGVCVYNSSDGKLVAKIANSMPPFAFNPQAAVMAVDSSKGIQLWDVEAGKSLRLLEHSDSIFTNANSRLWHQNALAFSPDGHSVVAARNTLLEGSIFVLDMWDSTTGKKVASLPAHRKAVEHSGVISSIAFDPNGQLLASGSLDHSIRLWDAGSGQCVDKLYGNSSEIWTLAFMANGQGLISGSKDGTVRLWPTNVVAKEKFYPGNWTPLKVSKNGPVLAAAPLCIKGKDALFSRNGALLVTFHDRSFKLWDPQTRSLKAEFPAEADFSFGTALAISDDGSILAAGSNAMRETENAIHLWDTRSGKPIGVCKGHTQGVRWLAFTPDAETLASVGDDSTLFCWNVRTQQELLSMQRLADPFRDILFSSDGNWLVAKTMTGLLLMDGSQESHDAKTTAQENLPTGQ